MTEVSAQPDELLAYAREAADINASIRADAGPLGAALSAFRASGSEFAPPVPPLEDALRAYADSADTVDRWVGEVGAAFQEAGQGDDGGFFRRAWGSVRRFGRGLRDGVVDPAKMVWELTPFGESPGQAWRDLGSGLWYGVTNPVEFGKAAIGWEHLAEGEYAYWLGNLAPTAVATIASGGTAAGVRGASATTRVVRSADRAGDAARTLRATDRVTPPPARLRTPPEGATVYRVYGGPDVADCHSRDRRRRAALRAQLDTRRPHGGAPVPARRRPAEPEPGPVRHRGTAA